MTTISTHNGTTYAARHNRRDRSITDREQHIDPNGKYEIWRDIDAREAYQKLFGDALSAYNERQVRADRKIEDYYTHVKNDKKQHAVYEMIVTVGSKDERVDEKTGREILMEFTSTWQRRNPNLALIGAYFHSDEAGAPHVHLDYVPVAHGYKKGMETRNGLVRALSEQGFEKVGRATAQILWEQRENIFLETICRSHGLTVEHPSAGKDVQHIDTKEYKATQERQRTLNKEIGELLAVKQNLQKERDAIMSEYVEVKEHLTAAEEERAAQRARERLEEEYYHGGR